MYSFLLSAVLAMLIPVAALASEKASQAEKYVINIMHYPQPDNAPNEVYALIEIPAGSFTKYELDAATGHLLVDRFQSMPVVYPANYGTLPSSLAGDNDPLDILVYTREAIIPGALVKVRPIGVITMLDGGEMDDKIIAVPTDGVDPTYAGIRDLADLAAIERERLVAFFTTYKQLPEGRKKVEVTGLGDRKMALKIIADSLAMYSSSLPNMK